VNRLMALLSSFSLLSFDVDGTLFRKPALTTAATALGIGEKWRTYDDMHLHNRITSRERLDNQFRLLSGLSITDVLKEVSKVEVIAGIRETVVKLQGHGLGVILLTDNPDFLCAYLVERFGFNGYVASKVSVKNGHISDDVQSMPDKRDALRKYCSWVSISVKKCIHVGDSTNDVPVFRVVGHSIALNSKSEKVRKVASKVLDTDNLLEVYHYLLSLGTEPQPNQ
jgi:HAD superfamily phosphoserine phosphatase-like hydrolase